MGVSLVIITSQHFQRLLPDHLYYFFRLNTPGLAANAHNPMKYFKAVADHDQ